MASNQITADQVVAAFEATGLKPINGSFFAVANGTESAHPLAAILQANGSMTARRIGEFSGASSRTGVSVSVAKLGLDPKYVEGFQKGWAGKFVIPAQPIEDTRRQLGTQFANGCIDGLAARSAMEAKGFVIEVIETGNPAVMTAY